MEIFQSEGLDGSRVISSHADIGYDLEIDKTVARMGGWVAYDHCGTLDTGTVQAYGQADENRADMIKTFIDAGLMSKLLVSADPNLFCVGWSRSSPCVGKATTADLLRFLPNKLRRIRISEDDFWKTIMTENPKKVIPIQ